MSDNVKDQIYKWVVSIGITFIGFLVALDYSDSAKTKEATIELSIGMAEMKIEMSHLKEAMKDIQKQSKDYWRKSKSNL